MRSWPSTSGCNRESESARRAVAIAWKNPASGSPLHEMRLVRSRAPNKGSERLMNPEVKTCATSSIGILSKNGRTCAVIASPSARPQLFSATLINFRFRTRSTAIQRTVGLLLVSIVLVFYALSSTRLSS